MAISTYAELSAAIAGWDKRTDLISLHDEFIALAEAEINRLLRVSQMETALAATSIASGVIARPADLVAFKSLTNTNNNRTPVEQKSLEYVRSHPSDGSIPIYYAWEAGNLRFNTESGEVSGVYYASVPALTSVADTNWLLTNSPDLYLMACLAESYAYQFDNERAAFYEAKRDRLIEKLNIADQRNRFSGNSLVARVA